MTADLVAEAIALCERQIVYWESVSETVPPLHAAHSKNQRNSWLTHKAEFGEHENHYIEVFPSDENYWLCNGCGESNAKDVDCEKKSTKAKRLLGKE